MPKAKRSGLFIDVPASLLAVLKDVAIYKGMPVEDYLRITVMGMVPEILEAFQARKDAEEAAKRLEAERAARRGPGRPAREAPTLLPPDLERGSTASGFAGVYQNGRYWKAFWDKGDGPLGIFELPEDAALARYWYNKGRLSVTLDALTGAGGDVDQVAAMARQLGALAPRKPFAIGDLVTYDPVIGEGPMRRGCRITGGPYQPGSNQFEGFPDGIKPGDVVEWAVKGFGGIHDERYARQEDLEHEKAG